jgi:hypothetical protein
VIIYLQTSLNENSKLLLPILQIDLRRLELTEEYSSSSSSSMPESVSNTVLLRRHSYS